MREDGSTQRGRHFLEGHHERFLSQLRKLQLPCASTRMVPGQGDAQRLAHNRPHRHVFGTASLTPTAIATILVTCILFALAIVLIELGLQTERKPHKLGLAVVRSVARSLARNPLIVSPPARVFALPLTLVQMAGMLCSLSTRPVPFMLAELHPREAHTTS